MIYVGFYVQKTKKIVDFEALPHASMMDIRMGSTQLAYQWQKNKRHTIPSPLWLAWGPGNDDDVSAFWLSDRTPPSESVFDEARDAALAYQIPKYRKVEV